jgi:hypothetical protein
MKTLFRISAVLSFLSCAVGGVWLLGKAIASKYDDLIVAAVIGLFLVGMAFFFGGILLFAAERLGQKERG